MELIGDFFGSINDLYLLIVTALGAALMALRGLGAKLMIGMLGGLGRGAGTGIGAKMTGGGSSSSSGSNGMPSSPRYKQAKHALYQASSRQTRMANYVNAWFSLLSLRSGPYALSVYLYSLMHPHFKEKVTRLRHRCRKFDALEAKAQHVLARYEKDFEKHCVPLRDDLIEFDIELTRWKAKAKRFGWQFWKRRYWYLARQIRKVRWKMVAVQLRLYFRTRDLNVVYRPFLEPAFKALEHYERIYLASWVHSFEADLESFKLTVVSGRLIDELISDEYADFRDFYDIGHLPTNTEELRMFLREELASEGIGFLPTAAIEGLFESWLRITLLKDDKMLKKWSISKHWLKYCVPPPGSIGIAQAEYSHLTNNEAWLPKHLQEPRLNLQRTNGKTSFAPEHHE